MDSFSFWDDAGASAAIACYDCKNETSRFYLPRASAKFVFVSETNSNLHVGFSMILSRLFKITDIPVGRASNWIGVITFFIAIFGAVSWPTSAFEAISRFGWGAIVIFALLFTCLILISIAIFLLSYHKFRMISTIGRSSTTGIKRKPDTLNNSIHGDNEDEMQNLLDSKISKIEDASSKKFREISDTLKYLEVMIVNSQEKTAELRDDVRSAFSAQRTYNTYKDLTRDIDHFIDQLSNPADKKGEFPDWQTWSFHYGRFKSQLTYMTRIVESYINVKETMLDVPSEKFKSQYWQFNEEGMSDDQKHDYKTFRILAANYRDTKSKIHSSLIDAIYQNP